MTYWFILVAMANAILTENPRRASMSETIAKEVTVWYAVLNGALLIPGTRVNCTAYLRKEQSASGVPSEMIELAIQTTQARAGVLVDIVDKLNRTRSDWIEQNSPNV
jgi:hypothetical protein